MRDHLDVLKRSPTRSEATIMFLDIRGFSTLFDQHDPMEVWSFANTVLSELGKVVEASGGAIDKFTGDGFLAHFGVIEPNENHVQDALRCAMRIRETTVVLNLQRYFDRKIVINVGMGIHTGLVASGVITAAVKSEFTVFGDVVNLASRIEGLTKEFLVDCLVSEAVFEICNHQFKFQKMPHRIIRGFNESRPTYWLLPINTIPHAGDRK